jgi:hypothetical protein
LIHSEWLYDAAQVFTTIVTKLLEPLLTLRSLILAQPSEDDAVRSQIKRHIEDIVLHSLFHPDHLFEYSLAFSLKQNVVTTAPAGVYHLRHSLGPLHANHIRARACMRRCS